ncbi:MAG: YjjG family noncanonical pyrimidine nucleotidase [Chitinophagaceae bacterium]
MKYKHLFFDLDHTLWDFETASLNTWKSLWETQQLQTRIPDGFDTFFKVYSAHNEEMWKLFRERKITREELRWKRIWKTFQDFNVYDAPLAHSLSDAYLEILPTQSALIPYALEVLEYCKGRYQMHLITNGFERTQKLKIEHAGIASYFSEIITSEMSDSIKPHPEIFRYAMRAAHAHCAECLMIGDAFEADILGAIGVGMDTVYFNPQKLQHEEKPTFQIESLKELIALL